MKRNFKERYCRVNIRGEMKDGRNPSPKKITFTFIWTNRSRTKFKGTVNVR